MKQIHFLLLIFIYNPVYSQTTAATADDLFYSDYEYAIEQVSEGDLKLLDKDKYHRVFSTTITMTLDQQSLDTGWVHLEQCFDHLDVIDKTDIEFNYKKISNLTIVSALNIQTSRVNHQTIHLEGIKQHAKLCLSAEVNNLYKTNNHTYQLKNGPYHRRFLDGYYPFQLNLIINYPKQSHPGKQIDFTSIQPSMLNNKIRKTHNGLSLSIVFEGILNIRIGFQRKT